MSDIVEQARKAASQGDFYLHNSLVYELIDEVERLQDYKRLQAEDIMTLGQQVGKLEAEIERLRAENMELRAERLLLQSWMPRSRQGTGDEK